MEVCGVELVKCGGAQGYGEPTECDDIGVVGVGQARDARGKRRRNVYVGGFT